MTGRTVLISPADLSDEAESALIAQGDAQRVWVEAPGFGDYLRAQRRALHLSLRHAGERIGISHTYLGQIEKGGGPTPLSPELYDGIAETYGLKRREVLFHAGCRFAVREDVAAGVRDVEQVRFETLLLDRALRPPGFTKKHLKLFPEEVRKYVIALIENADENGRRNGPSPDEMVAWAPNR